MANTHEQPQHPIAHMALRAGLALTALTGGGIAPPLTEKPPVEFTAAPSGPEASQPSHDSNPSTESRTRAEVKLPQAVQSYVNNNTVYINGEGCSGTLIHVNGQQNKPAAGVLFAKHCGFITDAPAWASNNGTPDIIKGSDGVDYDLRSPLVAETGNDESDLMPVGEIRQVIVGGGLDNDHILGVLPGFTPEQVISSYRDEHISDKQFDQLISGVSKIYVKGWPDNQKGSKPGVLRAEQFALVYIGIMHTVTSNGEELDLVVAAVPKEETVVDGATCSFGISGAGGVVLEHGEPKLIGPQSVFWGFDNLYNGNYSLNQYNPTAYRALMEQSFPDADWNKYAGACGFSYTMPEKTTTIQLTSDLGIIPGKGEPNASAAYELSLEFANPDYKRSILNGMVKITQEDKGGPGGPATFIVNRPIIANGPNGLIIGYYAAGFPGVINAIDCGLDCKASFYQDDPKVPLSVISSKGAIKYPADSMLNPEKSAYLHDAEGINFGALETTGKLPYAHATPYSIKYDNDRLSFKKIK
jgi:hypothetical protein